MKRLLVLFLCLTFIYAQDISDLFSGDSEELNTQQTQSIKQLGLTDLESLTYTPVELAIDPETYILGPGDLLGINIISTQNISLPLRVNPVGEIMIPSVGVLNVNGISLSDAKELVSEYIATNALQNAIVDITLLDLKRFKIQLLGAVNNPGYIYVSPVDGIYEIILNNGGVQKFADPNIIQIIRNGETINIDLSKYLSDNDQSQNIFVKSGDIIFVPYNEYAQSNNFSDTSYNNNQVIIYGFVNRDSRGNTFRYFPGYTVRDYIALAGGTVGTNSSFPIGNMKRAKIYRSDGTVISNALNENVLPGDMIEVPPKFMSQIVGNDGLIRTIASVISSAYLIYRYIEDQNN